MVNCRRVMRVRKGQGLIEYALILFFVAIVVFVALSLIGPQVGSIFSSVYQGFGG